MPLFEQVIQKVRRGELSRAAKKLVASPLAPGTQQTLDKLSDPRRRPAQLFRPISAEAQHHEPLLPAPSMRWATAQWPEGNVF